MEEGVDFIENWKVPSQVVLGSLHVNVTPRYEGSYEGYLPNTDQIRCFSDHLIHHFDSNA